MYMLKLIRIEHKLIMRSLNRLLRGFVSMAAALVLLLRRVHAMCFIMVKLFTRQYTGFLHRCIQDRN